MDTPENERNANFRLRDDLFNMQTNTENTNHTVADLDRQFSTLTLIDRRSSTNAHQPFQDEAAALPIDDLHNDINLVINQERDNHNHGAVPKYTRSRTFVNSLSDTDLRSPRYQSNYARNLQNVHNSTGFHRFNNDNNQNFPSRNQRVFNANSNSNNNNNMNAPQLVTNNPQSINDILQMAVLVPNFDGTEDTFENFEISCKDAEKILSPNNQKIFMKYIRDKFSGPIKLYLKIKLSNYNNIEEMLNDIKNNFLVRTPIHLLENKIFSISQNVDESVKEFGARLTDLKNILINRISDKFRGNVMRSKINDVENKVKKQMIQGLKRDLYVQFSLVDFRDYTLDQIIQTVAKSESKNKINENFDKLTKKVNFEQENLNKTELVEALTVAISNNYKARNRTRSPYNENYRDYSRGRYRNDRNSPYPRRNSKDRDYSRDRFDNYNRNRSSSRDRRNDYYRRRNTSRDRDNSRKYRHREYSGNRNYSRNRSYSRDRDNYGTFESRNPHHRQNNSYGHSRNSSRGNSRDRHYKDSRDNSRDRAHKSRFQEYNDRTRNGYDDKKLSNRKDKKRNSRSAEYDSDDSNGKNE